jgi:hypothetical protein
MQGLEITGPAATLLLLVPFVLLAAVVVVVTRRRRRSGSRRKELAVAADVPTEQISRTETLVLGLIPPQDGGEGVLDPVETGKPAREVRDFVTEIAVAEKSGDEASLVDLHRDHGIDLKSRGELGAAASEFGWCVLLASKSGRKTVQAQARLELGDIARESGDLTTACEHWQIARGLFLDLKEDDALGWAETRMRENGCPTDWVLNDF